MERLTFGGSRPRHGSEAGLLRRGGGLLRADLAEAEAADAHAQALDLAAAAVAGLRGGGVAAGAERRGTDDVGVGGGGGGGGGRGRRPGVLGCLRVRVVAQLRDALFLFARLALRFVEVDRRCRVDLLCAQALLLCAQYVGLPWLRRGRLADCGGWDGACRCRFCIGICGSG